MDFSKLSQNQQIALGGGVLAIISLFVPWYGVSGLGISINISAFDSGFLAWGGLLLTIAGAVILLLKAMDISNVRVGNLEAEQFALVLAGLGLVLIILRWITENDITKFGLYLGLISAAVVTYGAFGTMKDEGLEMPTTDDFKSSE